MVEYSHTKKVGSAGRFGPRYGRKLRVRLRNVEMKQKKAYKCPVCGFPKLKRAGTSIWVCSKCNAKLAGGAYTPETGSGKAVTKAIRRVIDSKNKQI
ncbi:50S ribosomal protein L37Ae [Methanococcus voltae]|uniref:Large ribosomal subunit protein eL43 n=2 Tax=Methanococcus voltae TaxID=2188 RepID=A0A8J7USL2_METVO|nr:50S ribosomal protein L37Ae [Methanococcus voltae]MBP2172275.1 large subunit ribosomal protein L37Ae [Methanococcus voltae]MBP2200769.1 large subunit ribosomal protein L37Ae [Methanococcus voltae]MCS3921493.1 large subunit ribosomal protein L37Ae [Methanococcus voltae PS]